MELKVNDLIEPIMANTVFRGKLYQVKKLNPLTIENLDNKQTLSIEERYLSQHFRKIDFKNIGSEQKDNDWFLDECRLNDNEPKEETETEGYLEPIYKLKIDANSNLILPEDTIDQIALARKLVKAKCKTLSVRNDRGTAYGWIDIRGSKSEWGEFTEEEKKALEELGLRYGLNCANISPENRKYYLRKWLGIPQKEKAEY